MSEAVKVGDEFAVDTAGRFSNYHSWRIIKVAKVTPSGKFRLEGDDGLWTASNPGCTEAYSSGGDMWSGRSYAYRVTDENRARFGEDNRVTKLRHRYNNATNTLRNRQFNADLMTEERVKMLEIFINLTEVHS